MRTNVLLGSLVVMVALAGCGVTPQDIDEIKGAQKDILAKLEALDTEIKKVKVPAKAAGRPQVDPNKVFKIPLGDSPLKGAKDGKVTIVKFSDYQCPFCAKADPLVNEMLAAYPDDVWGVSFDDGSVFDGHKSSAGYVRAVRDSP